MSGLLNFVKKFWQVESAALGDRVKAWAHNG